MFTLDTHAPSAKHFPVKPRSQILTPWLNIVCAFRVSETLFHNECWFQLQAVGLTNVQFTYSFAKDGGKQLQQNMEENKTITHIDLRLTECGTEAEYCIYQILHKNRERERELNIRKQKQTQTSSEILIFFLLTKNGIRFHGGVQLLGSTG